MSGVLAHEWTDAAIIMIVVILNAILGVFQEARSEAAIDALKEMATPMRMCAVMIQSLLFQAQNWFLEM